MKSYTEELRELRKLLRKQQQLGAALDKQLDILRQLRENTKE